MRVLGHGTDSGGAAGALREVRICLDYPSRENARKRTGGDVSFKEEFLARNNKKISFLMQRINSGLIDNPK